MESINPFLATKDILVRYLRNNNLDVAMKKFRFVRIQTQTTDTPSARDSSDSDSGISATPHFIAHLKKIQTLNGKGSVVVALGANTLTIPLDRISNHRATQAEVDAFVASEQQEGMFHTAPPASSLNSSEGDSVTVDRVCKTMQPPQHGVLGYRPHAQHVMRDIRQEERIEELERELASVRNQCSERTIERDEAIRQVQELHTVLTRVTLDHQRGQLEHAACTQRMQDLHAKIKEIEARHAHEMNVLKEEHSLKLEQCQQDVLRERRLEKDLLEEKKRNRLHSCHIPVVDGFPPEKRHCTSSSEPPLGENESLSAPLGHYQEDLIPLLNSAHRRIRQLTLQLTRLRMQPNLSAT